jgi:diacylglycerol kinase family enzyme
MTDKTVLILHRKSANEERQKLHCNLDGEPIRKKKLKFSVLPGRLRVAY